MLSKNSEYISKQNISQVINDFTKGFDELNGIAPSVTFFGSARFDENNIYYKQAYNLSFKLANKGYNIMSGGAGGIMEAANKGAYESARAESIGLNIQIEHEQVGNSFTTKDMTFEYFFTRKVMLIKYSFAYIVFPGGFGTLDELFETITLAKTKKINKISIFLVGTKYWRPLYDFIQKTMLENKTVTASEIEIITLTDDIDKITEQIDAKLISYINEIKNTTLRDTEYYNKALKQLQKIKNK